MESEKVKEIKNSIERKINRAEKVGDDLVNCVSVIALKEYLTLINELESENDTLHTNLCEWRKENKQLKDQIAELEKALEKEQINNLNCDTDLQYKEKRIAELEKGKKEHGKKKFLRGWKLGIEEFSERLKEKILWYPSVIESIDETLKELLCEK